MCNNMAFGNGNSQLTTYSQGSSITTIGCGNGATGNDDCDLIVGLGLCGNGALGNENDQNVRCNQIRLQSCVNSAVGNENNQGIVCNSVGTSGWINAALGDNNVQNMNCRPVGNNGCLNLNFDFITFAPGNDNNQKVNCLFVSTGCANNSTGNGNSQNLPSSILYPLRTLKSMRQRNQFSYRWQFTEDDLRQLWNLSEC